MAFIHIPAPWNLSEKDVTPDRIFFNRRRFLKNAIAAGVSATILPGCGSKQSAATASEEEAADLEAIATNPNFDSTSRDRPLTPRRLASRYNNFYEFGGSKDIWEAAQALPTEDWKVEVTGLVNNPKTYDLDDLQRDFPWEERIYRFRCVEAWAMVVPWIGFPMRLMVAAADPKPEAKYVKFSSFYDGEVMPGPGWRPYDLPWPYTEGLRIEEMNNELAFFATGIYDRTLPKQHGAPLRMVIPWKYGFKGAKSIVKIEFVADRPATFWNTLIPQEYGFEANVNPNVPHPRWSQASERLVGDGAPFSWERRPTLLYNGYEEYVGDLYA